MLLVISSIEVEELAQVSTSPQSQSKDTHCTLNKFLQSIVMPLGVDVHVEIVRAAVLRLAAQVIECCPSTLHHDPLVICPDCWMSIKDPLGIIGKPSRLVNVFLDVVLTLRRLPMGVRIVHMLTVYVEERSMDTNVLMAIGLRIVLPRKVSLRT